jgi:hypothetical protein
VQGERYRVEGNILCVSDVRFSAKDIGFKV